MSTVTDEQIRDAEAAFLVALAEHGMSPDIGELLARGDGRGRVAPGGLRKALTRALEAAEVVRRDEMIYDDAAPADWEGW